MQILNKSGFVKFSFLFELQQHFPGALDRGGEADNVLESAIKSEFTRSNPDSVFNVSEVFKEWFYQSHPSEFP